MFRRAQLYFKAPVTPEAMTYETNSTPNVN